MRWNGPKFPVRAAADQSIICWLIQSSKFKELDVWRSPLLILPISCLTSDDLSLICLATGKSCPDLCVLLTLLIVDLMLPVHIRDVQ